MQEVSMNIKKYLVSLAVLAAFVSAEVAAQTTVVDAGLVRVRANKIKHWDVVEDGQLLISTHHRKKYLIDMGKCRLLEKGKILSFITHSLWLDRNSHISVLTRHATFNRQVNTSLGRRTTIGDEMTGQERCAIDEIREVTEQSPA
jgi:Family of unknown function (DUF6491)